MRAVPYAAAQAARFDRRWVGSGRLAESPVPMAEVEKSRSPQGDGEVFDEEPAASEGEHEQPADGFQDRLLRLKSEHPRAAAAGAGLFVLLGASLSACQAILIPSSWC